MSHIFENPQDFLAHLERQVSNLDQLDEKTKHNLLHASTHAIRYLIESQEILSSRFVALVDCLNSAEFPTWGHRLAEIYALANAGEVTPEEMQAILEREVGV